MSTRTTNETITFKHPFKMSELDEVQPAGRYVVETNEELIQSLSFPVYRRLSTLIHLAGRSNSSELARVVDIDPAKLAAVRAIDAQAQEIVSISTHQRPTRPYERKRGAKEIVIAGAQRWLALNATELKWTTLIVGGMALAGLFT